MKKNKIKLILQNNPLIPVVKFNSMEEIDILMSYLIKNKINIIEVTLRTDISFKAISYIKKKYDKFIIGAGSVVDKNQILKLMNINIDFIVMPGFDLKLIEILKINSIPFLPGVMTPSEILYAIQNECYYLKFFPANISGGFKILKVYGDIFSNVYFCPTGGINEENYKNFLKLNNVISVGGSWLQKKINSD